MSNNSVLVNVFNKNRTNGKSVALKTYLVAHDHNSGFHLITTKTFGGVVKRKEQVIKHKIIDQRRKAKSSSKLIRGENYKEKSIKNKMLKIS